ncbi:DNA polymerase III subunit beta family protein [Kitasatospora cathayae]|uniref:MerR family transcriptional regulator n=1 Tax=Kitasatospora cathayae TaxID=3004092 RepID=A0ABY7QH45_9ACTN|nr:MerR family transcriptional regulator [Kitasatospora sp. HUAS 3-15]WBP92145.1 MerR family transcriptional regulator [Kitasatospora sp. HUAS 3-15]
MDGTTELLSISAFARRVGLAPSALRFYDDCRVLRPAWVDGATGYRFYSPAQEARAALLRGLRDAGLPLAEVAVVLDGPEHEGREVLERHLERMRDRTQAAKTAIAAALRSLSTADSKTEARIGGVELASAVRQVVPAAASDVERPALGCVLIEIDDGEVHLVATDRYRLSMRVLRPAALEGGPCRLLVHAADLIEFGQWAARFHQVTIQVGPDRTRARSTSESRVLVTVDDQFPDYREMLSALAPPEYRVIVDRLALRDAVNSHGDAARIALSFSGDEMTISLPDRSIATTLPAVCHQDLPQRIGFDPAVLAPALEASVGPDVLLEIAAADRPVVVRSADQGSFTTLVMPVALNTSS